MKTPANTGLSECVHVCKSKGIINVLALRNYAMALYICITVAVSFEQPNFKHGVLADVQCLQGFPVIGNPYFFALVNNSTPLTLNPYNHENN